MVQEIKGNKELAKLSQDAIGSTICYHADKNAFFTAGRSESMGVSLAPSSKTTMAMAIILQWLKDAPTDKIIGTAVAPEVARCLVKRRSCADNLL